MGGGTPLTSRYACASGLRARRALLASPAPEPRSPCAGLGKRCGGSGRLLARHPHSLSPPTGLWAGEQPNAQGSLRWALSTPCQPPATVGIPAQESPFSPQSPVLTRGLLTSWAQVQARWDGLLRPPLPGARAPQLAVTGQHDLRPLTLALTHARPLDSTRQ